MRRVRDGIHVREVGAAVLLCGVSGVSEAEAGGTRLHRLIPCVLSGASASTGARSAMAPQLPHTDGMDALAADLIQRAKDAIRESRALCAEVARNRERMREDRRRSREEGFAYKGDGRPAHFVAGG